MRILQVLLTSALSLLLAGPGFARDAAVRAPSDLLILAQNDAKCPSGSKCAERRKEGREKRAGDRGQKGGRGKGQDAKQQGGGNEKGQNARNQRGNAEQGRGKQGDAQQGRGKQGEKSAGKAKREAGQKAAEPRNQRGDAKQGNAKQGRGKQGDNPSGKAKREAGQKAAEPRNQRRNADKPLRREQPAAGPARNEKPRAEPQQKRSEQRDDRREQREIRRERREQRREQAVEKPAQQNGAERPRDRDQNRKAAPERSRQPARDRDRAQPAQAPSNVRERPRADQGPATGTREERRRERAERRARRREDAKARPVRQPDRDATTVERQLAAQGRGDEADRVRELRRKLRRQREAAQERRAERRENAQERREDRREERAEQRERRRDREVVERRGDRVIVRFGANLFIEPEEVDDRLLWRARDVEVEEFGDGFTRTIVYRENGVRVETVRDRYGNVVSRTRYLPEGREVVLIGQPYVDYPPEPVYYEEISLPPLVVPLPQPEYIVETRVATPVQIETALTAPPVEAVERAYTLEEVRRSERLRDKMRRVDIDTITFEFGSAVIPEDQLESLDRVGEAIEETLRTDPDEVFLIEGHTDAVGSPEDNLVLSDRRAEAVAVALSEEFDIPPENLVTQGYGEDQLKLETEAAERQNRRVAVRRITPLLEGVAQRQ